MHIDGYDVFALGTVLCEGGKTIDARNSTQRAPLLVYNIAPASPAN